MIISNKGSYHINSRTLGNPFSLRHTIFQSGKSPKYTFITILLLICVLFVCSSCGTSDKKLLKTDSGKPYSDWGQSTTGSAKYLDGDTVLVSIFLNDKAAAWTNEDVKLVKKNMETACTFLKDEGIKYGKDVNLIYNLDEHPDLEYHCIMETAFPGTTLSNKEGASGEAAKKLRRDVYDYISHNINIEYIMAKYQTNSIAFLVFIDNEADAATTYGYYFGADKNRYCELCFINLRWSTNGSELKPETYAHEILHLFGARDLYSTDTMNGITRDFIDYVNDKYPKDIMLGNSRKGVNRNNKVDGEITDITAYFIGWKENIAETSRFPTIKTEYKASFVYSEKLVDNNDEYTLPERIIQEENYRKNLILRLIRIICYGVIIYCFIIDIRRIVRKRNEKSEDAQS